MREFWTQISSRGPHVVSFINKLTKYIVFLKCLFIANNSVPIECPLVMSRDLCMHLSMCKFVLLHSTMCKISEYYLVGYICTYLVKSNCCCELFIWPINNLSCLNIHTETKMHCTFPHLHVALCITSCCYSGVIELILHMCCVMSNFRRIRLTY